MSTRELWDYVIDTKEIDIKEGFVLRKGKIYLLSREEREEMHEFISEQLRKRYIRFLKLPQTALVFFCREEGWEEVDGIRLLISQ